MSSKENCAVEKDIFDKIMELPVLRIFNEFYKKYKSVLLYLFFGGCTTVISVGSFILLNLAFENFELVNNIISWILAVLFAFFTNRKWVFNSTEKGNGILKEMIKFFAGRLSTLGIEELIILIFISWLGFNSTAVKIAAQIVVLILNYIVSKLFVFKKRKGNVK